MPSAAFNAGAWARAQGKPATANPYRPANSGFREWARGWARATAFPMAATPTDQVKDGKGGVA